METSPSASRPLTIGGLLLLALVAGILFGPLTRISFGIFAGVLFTIFLDALIRIVQQVRPIPRLAALGSVVLAFLALLGGFWLLVGPRLANEATELVERLPEAFGRLSQLIQASPLAPIWNRHVSSPEEALRAGGSVVLGGAQVVVSTLFGAVTSISVVVLIGVYAAANPEPYVAGFLRLVPPRRRARAEQVVAALGEVLRWWLVGRFVSMVAVGVFTGFGLWGFGIGLPLALGAIAGSLAFIPFIGPIIAAVPALLIGLNDGLVGVVQVLAVYGLAQALEGNLITPLVQRRAVSLAPAVLLSAQFAFGVLFGFVGILLATPLAVVLMVLVRMLYVEDVLGDTVEDSTGVGDDGGSGDD